MKKINVIFALILTLGGGFVIYLIVNKEPDIQSTWVWDTREFQANSERYFHFLTEKRISKLYVQIDQELAYEEYEKMIEAAHAMEIAVFAIDGAKDWVQQLDELNNTLEWLKEYHRQVNDAARFDGLLLDVEPYLLDEWETEQLSILKGYQEVVRIGSEFSQNENVPFEMAIPFWFYQLEVEGENLLTWMYSYIDTVLIMSYRTELEGENGFHAIVAPYFEEFASDHVDIVLTVETESLEGEEQSISFSEKTESEMNQFISTLNKKYRNVQGISVHHLHSWIKLHQKTEGVSQ
ncbi:hypothetical protein [Halalkalibacter akibai]|uniref:Amidase n=1 Tax=Halalkalibacter akibai (strain ATCC 43226 / DSM 21942 / CIP 109018 / JCM 9157 / 1139) TaxID=1236973 RepID=W4QRH2_HALA3|nr:hypothetical protein [Halalkalibacter akibai]GAE34248.1 hypothetical protein JCM9157_1294 [Halalkalibacter akibai JCM 9157]